MYTNDFHGSMPMTPLLYAYYPKGKQISCNLFYFLKKTMGCLIGVSGVEFVRNSQRLTYSFLLKS